MPKRKIFVVSICILAVAGSIMLFRTPPVTTWMAEQMVEKGLTEQIRQLECGGEISVSSEHLDSVWHDGVRYVMIIPPNSQAESVLKIKEILRTESFIYNRENILGAYFFSDDCARLLCEQVGLLVLPQRGFGLVNLRSDHRIGIYHIRRGKALQNQSKGYYLLKLESEF